MKKLFFPLLMFAAAMSSCADDEVDNAYMGDTDTDNLLGITAYAMTPTSKGSDTTTETLANTSGYVELHIDDAGSISQTQTFKYDGDDWLQDEVTKIQWDDISFPANFYSLHDDDPITMTEFDSGYATWDYIVDGASTTHKDLVYHASELNAIPTGGKVNAYHRHALSKINLLANTGTNNVYVARAQLIYVDKDGTVTITPLDADKISKESGATWDIGVFDAATYLYHYIGTGKPEKLTSTTTSNPKINDAADAPMMIIPQATTAATVTGDDDGLVASIENTYVEVIYYMTDVENNPVVGFSSVAARPDASSYIKEDQAKTLYVMAAFPLGHTFEINKEYDLLLGLGGTNTTGGILIKDNYVDKDGVPISLTTDSCTTTPEIPEIDDGDNILGDSSDDISIVVTSTPWDDGDDKTLEGNK